MSDNRTTYKANVNTILPEIPDNSYIKLRQNAQVIIDGATIGNNTIIVLHGKSRLEIKKNSLRNKVKFVLYGDSTMAHFTGDEDKAEYELHGNSKLYFPKRMPAKKILDAIQVYDSAKVLADGGILVRDGKKMVPENKSIPHKQSQVNILNTKESNVSYFPNEDCDEGIVIDKISSPRVNVTINIENSIVGKFLPVVQDTIFVDEIFFLETRSIVIIDDDKVVHQSNLNEFCERAQKNIHDEDATALKQLLVEKYYSINTTNEISCCLKFTSHTHPFLEVLFWKDPEKFLDLFNQVKAKPSLYDAFIQALNQTSLNELNKEWDNEILELVNSNLIFLKNHSMKLAGENAQRESMQVALFKEKLTSILATPNSCANKTESKAEFKLFKSPPLAQKIEFAATMHLESRSSKWDNHRKLSKVLAANFVLCLLGCVVLYAAAVAFNGGLFFTKTMRRQKMNEVQKRVVPQRSF